HLIGEHAHEESHHDVKHDEGEARQQSKFGVRKPEVRHDEIRKTREQLPVDEIHHIENREEYQEHIVARRNAIVRHVQSSDYATTTLLSRCPSADNEFVTRQHS